jgi:hypothetical protein
VKTRKQIASQHFKDTSKEEGGMQCGLSPPAQILKDMCKGDDDMLDQVQYATPSFLI